MTPKGVEIQLLKHNQHTPRGTVTQENKTGSCFLRVYLRQQSPWQEGREAQCRDVSQGQVRDGVREEGTLSKGKGMRLMFEGSEEGLQVYYCAQERTRYKRVYMECSVQACG